MVVHKIRGLDSYMQVILNRGPVLPWDYRTYSAEKLLNVSKNRIIMVWYIVCKQMHPEKLFGSALTCLIATATVKSLRKGRSVEMDVPSNWIFVFYGHKFHYIFKTFPSVLFQHIHCMEYDLSISKSKVDYWIVSKKIRKIPLQTSLHGE